MNKGLGWGALFTFWAKCYKIFNVGINWKGDIKMNQSPLQKARYQYSPKSPGMLRNGISEICVKEGNATQSVADQEKIAALFPNTYGEKEITFEKG